MMKLITKNLRFSQDIVSNSSVSSENLNSSSLLQYVNKNSLDVLVKRLESNDNR